MKRQNTIRKIFMIALLFGSFAFFGAVNDVSAQDGGLVGSGGRSGYMGSGGGLIGSTGGRSGFINGGERAENAASSQTKDDAEAKKNLFELILNYLF